MKGVGGVGVGGGGWGWGKEMRKGERRLFFFFFKGPPQGKSNRVESENY